MREISRRSIDLLVLWNISFSCYLLWEWHSCQVVKVSEHASWSGCFYVQILQTALAAVRAPENLVEVITRFSETGEALVSSVDKIIFVGSPGVGRMIMRKAADTFIPVTLELGGKDPFIVCEDVDVAHELKDFILLNLSQLPEDMLRSKREQGKQLKTKE
ncbi:unnamed protein product [Lactuca saligna]|uniref:Aldehyde dehydrogenase domain-containing protein n=1 Tax=Lactuca saligna TaxID=75948 RepID=A0AA36E4E3_LACSI|nr:unnamed protein product [Lactuca saligna]